MQFLCNRIAIKQMILMLERESYSSLQTTVILTLNMLMVSFLGFVVYKEPLQFRYVRISVAQLRASQTQYQKTVIQYEQCLKGFDPFGVSSEMKRWQNKILQKKLESRCKVGMSFSSLQQPMAWDVVVFKNTYCWILEIIFDCGLKY